MTRLGAGRLGF